MDTWRKFMIILAVIGTTTSIDWSGHVCPYIDSLTSTSLECVEYGVNCHPMQSIYSCCEWQNVTRTKFVATQRCCPGWSEYIIGNGNCNTSICNETCIFNQICSAEGNCENQCHGQTSSDLPCYPGSCATGTCRCQNGFYGSGCSAIHSSLSPKIQNVKIQLKTVNKTLSKRIIFLHSESAWTNVFEFNSFQIDMDVTFLSEDFPPLPSSLRNVSLYVRNADVSVDLERSKTNESISLSYNSCSRRNNAVLPCTTTGTNDRILDPNDKLQVTVRSLIGGKYTLRNGHTGTYIHTFRSRNTFGITFDFLPPKHSNAPGNAFIIKPEISKRPVSLSWQGWSDDLSGIRMYTVLIYQMKLDHTGHLRQPFQPVAKFNFNSSMTSLIYTPMSSGVYSYILQVSDFAGNIEYARQFGIYDPDSKIYVGTNTGMRMLALSATYDSNYKWQNKTGKIIIYFKNHFQNKKQVLNGFLKPIILSPELGYYNFSIKPMYDDFNSTRSVNAIYNVDGIIKLEYIGKKTVNGQSIPSSGWNTIPHSNMSAGRIEIQDGNSNGNSYTIWMRAHDIMGNIATDMITVFFDTSEPLYSTKEKVLITNNVDGKYSTRVKVRVYDRDSGILKVEWNVIDRQTQETLASGYIPGNITDTARCDGLPGDCDCIQEGSCFFFDHILFIHHCDIHLSNSKLGNRNLDLRITAYNGASLTKTKIVQFGSTSEILGVNMLYPKPTITSKFVSDTGVRLDWTYKSICFNNTGIDVSYKSPSGERIHLDIPMNSESVSVEGLKATSEYTFYFQLHYGNQTSKELVYTIHTEGVKIPTSYIAGITVVTLFAVLCLVGFVYYCRNHNRYQQLQSKLSDQRITMSDLQEKRNENRNRKLPTLHDKVKEFEPESKPKQHHVDMHSACEMQDTYDDTLGIVENTAENIYEDLHGHHAHSIQDASQYSREQIHRNLKLHEGHFGTIYSGNLVYDGENYPIAIRSHNVTDTNGSSVTEFESSIKEIISQSQSIGQHENILSYLGYVIDNDEPPMLVMELCENGCLRNWLDKEHNALRQNRYFISKLHEIALGVAKGMEYLISKQICHGSLNSYEVLLTEGQIPKIKDYFSNSNTKSYKQWQAPEIIDNGNNSPQADVWAFAILLWEIFEMDKIPFHDVVEDQLLDYLYDGKRMEIPNTCDERHATVLNRAWQLEARDRPSFTEIILILTDDMHTSGIYLNEEEEEGLRTFSHS